MKPKRGESARGRPGGARASSGGRVLLRLLPYGLLVAMTAVAYAPVAHAKFIWDDNDYPERVMNSLSGFDGLKAIWADGLNAFGDKPLVSLPQYYPLVFSTYWVENALWGSNPMGYHIVNVLLHAISVILLWRLLTALRVPGAIWAAALFAVHPMCVESVAWVTERKNTLSLMFYLLAMLTYLPLAGLSEPAGLATAAPTSRRRNGLRYAAVVLLFIAALLSKTVTVTFPAAVLVITWWKHGRLSLRDLLRMAPFFVLSIAAGRMTAMVERNTVGAAGGDWTLNIVERVMLAGHVVWFYIYKLLWPAELIFNYSHWDISWKIPWQYLPTAGLVGALVTLWLLRKRIGRGPLAAGLLLIGTLFPALGFINVYPFRFSYVADHFAYMGIPVILALLAVGATRLMTRCGPRMRLPLCGVAAAVLVLLGALTWRQACVYQEPETLWKHTLTHNPQAWMAYNNYGALLTSYSRLAEAYPMFDRCISLRPDCAEAYNNWGNALAIEKRYAEALVDFDKAVALGVNAMYHHNRGVALENLGQPERSIEAYSKAIEMNPRYAPSYQGRGESYLMISHPKEAIADFSMAIAKDPKAYAAWTNRGRSYLELHDVARAMADCQQCIKIDPSLAAGYVNRGLVYHALGQYDKAVDDYTKAISLKGDTVEAYFNRAYTMQAMQDFSRAAEDLSRVIQLSPRMAQAYHRRGQIYQLMDRNCDAIDDFTQALKLDGNRAEILVNRGLAYHALGQNDKAVDDYTKAISLKSDTVEAYFNRAITMQAMQDFSRAAEDLSRVIQLSPRMAQAYHRRGQIYQVMDRNFDAIDDFTQALKLDGNRAEILVDRGNSYANLGRHEDSLGDYNAAIALNPSIPELYNNRAIAYFRLKQFDLAWQDVHTCQQKSGAVKDVFLRALEQASGRKD